MQQPFDGSTIDEIGRSEGPRAAARRVRRRSISPATHQLLLPLKKPTLGLAMILSGTSPRAASRNTCFVVRRGASGSRGSRRPARPRDGRGRGHVPRGSRPSKHGRSSGACRPVAPSARRWRAPPRADLAFIAPRYAPTTARRHLPSAPRRSSIVSSASPASRFATSARATASPPPPPLQNAAPPRDLSGASQKRLTDDPRDAVPEPRNRRVQMVPVAAEQLVRTLPDSATVTCRRASRQSAMKPSAERSASGSSICQTSSSIAGRASPSSSS